MTDAVPAAAPAVLKASSPAGEANAARDEELRKTAKAFESVFVAQMLSYGGLTEALGANAGFGGEAFSGLLVEQYADQLVERGGFGIADKIYDQLRERGEGDGGRTVR
jgi:flagellar protein FlgJ